MVKELKVGDIIKVKHSFYKHMDDGKEYLVINVWEYEPGSHAYSFKKLGKSGKGTGKSFSHEKREIDNSLGSSIEVTHSDG